MVQTKTMNFMNKTWPYPFQPFGIIALFFALSLSACNGISTRGGSTSCAANTAQITVYEGAMSRSCGCAEGTGTFTQAGSMACTVSFNTAVYFYFVGISNPHQIAITNIGSTPQIDVNTNIKTSAIVLNQVGTFTFQDIFNGIGGSFIVNP